MVRLGLVSDFVRVGRVGRGFDLGPRRAGN